VDGSVSKTTSLPEVRFESIGEVELTGLGRSLELFEATRA
jgi:hypothetical protein